MNPYLRYTLLRLAIFVAAIGALWLAGARGWLLVLIAAVVSMAASYVVLSRQRDALVQAMEQRRHDRDAAPLGPDELAEDAAAEDRQPRQGHTS